MKIAFYGSSLLSSYWNGAATYYRGILKALATLGYDITFYEPDILDRQVHRDIAPPAWAGSVVYPANPAGLKKAAAEAARADIVIKASGVGYADDALLEAVMAAARPGALRIYWDVDAPATLAETAADPDHPLRRMLPQVDLVLTYGGGDPVTDAFSRLGARTCVPVYNAVDPETHFSVAPDSRFESGLSFLGNRLPDREARVDEFFFDVARACPQQGFLLGGAGWDSKDRPENVRYLGHVGTGEHNAFNSSPRAILNISRDSMAANGFSPATRVFEATGAGACLITDHWTGIEQFFKPSTEILVARDGKDVAELMLALDPEKAAMIGQAALERVLHEHTYRHRAEQTHRLFMSHMNRLEIAAE